MSETGEKRPRLYGRRTIRDEATYGAIFAGSLALIGTVGFVVFEATSRLLSGIKLPF